MYSYCDVLTTPKLHELSSLFKTENQEIICLSEVKPKNFQRTLTHSEYNIFGYNMGPLDILNQDDIGMLLYLKDDLSTMNVPTHITSLQELIVICKLISERDIILAFTYESPNSRN